MRRLPLHWLSVSSLGLVVLSAFLPWVRTGEATRSSYRLLRDLSTLGVLRSGPATAGRVTWVLLPAVAALALLLMSLGRTRAGSGVGALAAIIGLGGALTVLRSPVAALVGVWVMVAAAPSALTFCLLTVVVGDRRARGVPAGAAQPIR